MENNAPDNTIKEILEEDRVETRRRRRGNGCLLRLLIIAVLLFIGFYGFILFRQKMLDLEAEAVICARQTLTSQAGQSESPPAEVISDSTEKPAESEEASMLERTATIAAQLTSVAEFQLTATPDQ